MDGVSVWLLRQCYTTLLETLTAIAVSEESRHELRFDPICGAVVSRCRFRVICLGPVLFVIYVNDVDQKVNVK
ncbi:hypothetical protein J6590_081227 [Homalodisca vitripennis]|nr:hypothetical protein J6590_081227 [Homalodisca vitripennis]